MLFERIYETKRSKLTANLMLAVSCIGQYCPVSPVWAYLGFIALLALSGLHALYGLISPVWAYKPN